MAEIKRFENFHILLWLLKDMSWLMMWRIFGICMIVPTLGFAILITWKKRGIPGEFFYNLTIIFWISANSFWMVTEFFDVDHELKIFALIPFIIGLVIILGYHIHNYLRNSSRT